MDRQVKTSEKNMTRGWSNNLPSHPTMPTMSCAMLQHKYETIRAELSTVCFRILSSLSSMFFFCPAHSLCPNIPQGQARKSLGWAPHWNYLPGWGLHKQYASLLELRTASMVAILTPTKTELTDLNTKDVDFHCPVLLSDTR